MQYNSIIAKIQKKNTYLAVSVSIPIMWPSLGSNQGLADYEKRQEAFQMLSFKFKVFDYIEVTDIASYFWFHLISQKDTTCCTYVVPKTKKNERKYQNCM